MFAQEGDIVFAIDNWKVPPVEGGDMSVNFAHLSSRVLGNLRQSLFI